MRIFPVKSAHKIHLMKGDMQRMHIRIRKGQRLATAEKCSTISGVPKREVLVLVCLRETYERLGQAIERGNRNSKKSARSRGFPNHFLL